MRRRWLCPCRPPRRGVLLQNLKLADNGQLLCLAVQRVDDADDGEDGDHDAQNGRDDPSEDGNDPKHRRDQPA